MSSFYAYPSFMERFGDEEDENGPLVSARWQTIISNGTQVRTSKSHGDDRGTKETKVVQC